MKNILHSVGNNLLWIAASFLLLLIMALLTIFIYLRIANGGFTVNDLEFMKGYSLLISIGYFICLIIITINFYKAGRSLKTID
jgi:hypothetical protein